MVFQGRPPGPDLMEKPDGRGEEPKAMRMSSAVSGVVLLETMLQVAVSGCKPWLTIWKAKEAASPDMIVPVNSLPKEATARSWSAVNSAPPAASDTTTTSPGLPWSARAIAAGTRPPRARRSSAATLTTRLTGPSSRYLSRLHFQVTG